MDGHYAGHANEGEMRDVSEPTTEKGDFCVKKANTETKGDTSVEEQT